MGLSRYTHYMYLVAAVILAVALVRESQGGRQDSTNLIMYAIALALSVALFELRRRHRRTLDRQDKTPPSEPSNPDR